ncbi:MAG: hypothetical protein AABX02_04880 [archaeon]
MSDETPPIVSWHDIFAEGERRIQSYFLDATVITDPQDRVRLLTRRRVIKQRMQAALSENDPVKLQRTIREQVRLLAHVSGLCQSSKENHSSSLPISSV